MIRSILFSEYIKRSSVNLIITIVIPLFILMVVGVGFAGNVMGDEIENTWETFLLQLNMALLFFFPLGITIITSQLASIEHQSNYWKVLLSLPFDREYIYYGKLIYALAYSILSTIIFFIGVIVLGLMLNISGFETIPWLTIIKQVFYPVLGTFAIISFQLFLSMFIKNQAFPIMIGVVTSIFTYSLMIFPLNISKWLFWTYPTLASPLKPLFEDNNFSGVMVSNDSEIYLLLSLLIGTLISFLGAKLFAKQDIK